MTFLTTSFRFLRLYRSTAVLKHIPHPTKAFDDYDLRFLSNMRAIMYLNRYVERPPKKDKEEHWKYQNRIINIILRGEASFCKGREILCRLLPFASLWGVYHALDSALRM